MNKHYMQPELFLQLFADGDAAGADGEGGTAGEGTQQQGETGGEDKPEDKKGKGKPEAKYTDGDIDRIINRKFAEWQKKKNADVAEAKKLAEMNAQEKAEYERDQLQKELDKLKKETARTEMTKTARKMISDNGINVPDELLTLMIADDAGETKAAVDGFIKLFSEAVENAVKDRLKGKPPRKGGGVTAMTKEQIMAIKDPELRQKKMLENRHLFNF